MGWSPQYGRAYLKMVFAVSASRVRRNFTKSLFMGKLELELPPITFGAKNVNVSKIP